MQKNKNQLRKAINLKVHPKLHDAVAQAAKNEHRTINNFVEKTLLKATNLNMDL
jgi:hypothetical protein